MSGPGLPHGRFRGATTRSSPPILTPPENASTNGGYSGGGGGGGIGKRVRIGGVSNEGLDTDMSVELSEPPYDDGSGTGIGAFRRHKDPLVAAGKGNSESSGSGFARPRAPKKSGAGANDEWLSAGVSNKRGARRARKEAEAPSSARDQRASGAPGLHADGTQQKAAQRSAPRAPSGALASSAKSAAVAAPPRERVSTAAAGAAGKTWAPNGAVAAARGVWGGQKQGDRRKHTPRVPCLLQSLAAPRIDGEVTPRDLLYDVYISVKGTNAAAPGAPTVFANPTARSLNDSLFISEIASSYTDVYSVDTVIRLYAIVPLAGVAGDETPIALRFADQRDAEGALFAIRASTPPTWTVMSIAPTPAEGNGAIKRTNADAANCDVVTYRVDGLLDVETVLRSHILEVLHAGAATDSVFASDCSRGVTGTFAGTPLGLAAYMKVFFNTDNSRDKIEFSSSGHVDGIPRALPSSNGARHSITVLHSTTTNQCANSGCASNIHKIGECGRTKEAVAKRAKFAANTRAEGLRRAAKSIAEGIDSFSADSLLACVTHLDSGASEGAVYDAIAATMGAECSFDVIEKAAASLLPLLPKPAKPIQAAAGAGVASTAAILEAAKRNRATAIRVLGSHPGEAAPAAPSSSVPESSDEQRDADMAEEAAAVEQSATGQSAPKTPAHAVASGDDEVMQDRRQKREREEMISVKKPPARAAAIVGGAAAAASKAAAAAATAVAAASAPAAAVVGGGYGTKLLAPRAGMSSELTTWVAGQLALTPHGANVDIDAFAVAMISDSAKDTREYLTCVIGQTHSSQMFISEFIKRKMNEAGGSSTRAKSTATAAATAAAAPAREPPAVAAAAPARTVVVPETPEKPAAKRRLIQPESPTTTVAAAAGKAAPARPGGRAAAAATAAAAAVLSLSAAAVAATGTASATAAAASTDDLPVYVAVATAVTAAPPAAAAAAEDAAAVAASAASAAPVKPVSCSGSPVRETPAQLMTSRIAAVLGPALLHLASLEGEEIEAEFRSIVSSVTDKSQLRLATSDTVTMLNDFINMVPDMDTIRGSLPAGAHAVDPNELLVLRGSVVNLDNGQRVSVVIAVNLFFAAAVRIALRRHNAWDGSFKVQLCIRAPPGQPPTSPSATPASLPGSAPTTPSAAVRRE